MKKLLFILILMFPIVVFGQDIFWQQIKPISAQVNKSNPALNDLILIQDSSASIGFEKKYMTIQNLVNSIKATRLDAATGLDTLRYMTPSNVALFAELNYVPHAGTKDDLYMDTFNIQAGNADLQTMRLDTSYVSTGVEDPGTVFWDKVNRTYSIVLGNGVVIQINQESLVQVRNLTGDTLKDGRVVGFVQVLDEKVAVRYASSNERFNFLGATTEEILPGDVGFVVSMMGKLNNITTGTISTGEIYLDTLGYFTNLRPPFPNYAYPIGVCLKTGITDGIIQFRSDGVNYKNSVTDAFDGTMRETLDFRTFSDGVTIKGVLSNPLGTDKLTMIVSDGWFDVTVPDTITLTPGTSGNKQMNYIYIPHDTRVITVSLTGYPEGEEFVQLASVGLYDAVTTQLDGAIINQNINNEFKVAGDNGHIVHIGDKLRGKDADWIRPGLAVSLSGYPANLYITSETGIIKQMHNQNVVALSMPTDRAYIMNDPVSGEIPVDNLNTITSFSDGTSWLNNWGRIVVWVTGNKGGEESHLMVNLPRGGYLTEQKAIDDQNGYANFDIPYDFVGKGVLLGAFVIKLTPSGWVYNPTTGYLDLRGKYPNRTAGGNVGTSGITQYTQLIDTEADIVAYAFQRGNSTGTLLENVLASEVFLTEFDSAGFVLHQSQISGLNDSLANYVPYTGATSDVDLGEYDIMADSAQINHLRINQSATPGYVWTATDAAGNGAWSSAITGMTYLGSWNASTNTPTLSDATGSSGHTYAISVTGTRDLGSGSITWTAGGFAIHNGSVYEYIGSDAVVSSVNGLLGNVSLFPEITGNLINIVGNTTTIDISAATAVSNNTDSIPELRTDINANTTKIDSFIVVADVATVLDVITGIVNNKRITPIVFSTAFALLSEQTDKEVPVGLINGVNDTYTVSRDFIAYTTEVFKNGVVQTINVHYTEILNGIVMKPDYLLDIGDIIEIKYRY